MAGKMITAPRMTGKCLERGCRHRKVIQGGVTPGVAADRRGNLYMTDGIPENGSSGQWPLYFVGGKAWCDSMRALGLVCPTHGRILEFKGIMGKYNPEKECDGRCMGAVGPSCDCQCGGENHGAASVMA